MERLGQPNADPITVSTDVLFEAIAADGFKVALTGDGSDEVFGGYARFSRARAGGDLGAYVDDIGSWSTNEITINWNAPLSWVSSFVADLDRGDDAGARR